MRSITPATLSRTSLNNVCVAGRSSRAAFTALDASALGFMSAGITRCRALEPTNRANTPSAAAAPTSRGLRGILAGICISGARRSRVNDTCRVRKDGIWLDRWKARMDEQ